MAPLLISVEPCPCCGLAHKKIAIFATESLPKSRAATGKRIKLWYVCTEFGQRVPVDFNQAAPEKEQGNY